MNNVIKDLPENVVAFKASDLPPVCILKVAASDKSRPALQGVIFDGKHFYAADGYCLVRYPYKGEQVYAPRLILPDTIRAAAMAQPDSMITTSATADQHSIFDPSKVVAGWTRLAGRIHLDGVKELLAWAKRIWGPDVNRTGKLLFWTDRTSLTIEAGDSSINTNRVNSAITITHIHNLDIPMAFGDGGNVVGISAELMWRVAEALTSHPLKLPGTGVGRRTRVRYAKSHIINIYISDKDGWNTSPIEMTPVVPEDHIDYDNLGALMPMNLVR